MFNKISIVLSQLKCQTDKPAKNMTCLNTNLQFFHPLHYGEAF